MAVERYADLSDGVIARIGALLGAVPRQASYRAGGDAVYELALRSLALEREITLLLWPGLRRADVRLGDSTMVFKHFDGVELYPGVEVLFRRDEPPGYLFVSVGGRASMVV